MVVYRLHFSTVITMEKLLNERAETFADVQKMVNSVCEHTGEEGQRALKTEVCYKYTTLLRRTYRRRGTRLYSKY